MEQSPSWEANRFSVSQEIPCNLQNPNVHYRIHKCPPPVPILCQLDSCSHIPLPQDPSTSGSPQWSLSLRFPYQNPAHASSLPIRATCAAHLILLDFITRTTFGEQYRSLSSSLCSFLHSSVTSSILGSDTLNTLFSDTLSLRSSLSMSNQVLHPYKTTGKIIALYILICKFFDSQLEDYILIMLSIYCFVVVWINSVK